LTPLNLEYTYITLFGFKLFEPVTILTNSTVVFYGLFAFLRILSSDHVLSRYWGMAFLLVGLSNFLSAITHGVHEQLGDTFLRVSWFLSNAVSLICLYFFYRAAFTFSNVKKENTARVINYVVLIWVAALLVVTFFLNDFLLIKIHAGIALVYSLIVHVIMYKKKHPGSGYIVAGISISFLSIIVHSIKFSFSEWFNYKDIAHMIMLVSLILLYKGVRRTIGLSKISAEHQSA
jgi:hypothetical protein